MVEESECNEPQASQILLREKFELAQMGQSYLNIAEKGILVLKDGTLVADRDLISPGYEFLLHETNIKKVAFIKNHDIPVILLRNGKIKYPENPNRGNKVGLKTRYILHKAESWENIIDIVCNENTLFGLTKEGNIKYVSTDNTYADAFKPILGWRGIKQISCSSKGVVGLTYTGKVILCGLDDYNETDSWEDIIAVATGSIMFSCGKTNHKDYYILGLTEDGHVLFAGDKTIGRERERRYIDSLRNIVQISCQDSEGICALAANGTIKQVSYRDVLNDYISCDITYDAPENIDEVNLSVDNYPKQWTGVVSCKWYEAVGTNGEVAGFGKKVFSNVQHLQRLHEQALEAEAELFAVEKERSMRRQMKVCQNCGGSFKGWFRKVCTVCGQKKDY